MVIERGLAPILAAALAVSVAGCGVTDTEAEATPAPSATASATSSPIADPAAQLDGLRRVERRPEGLSAYRRDAFGPAWADVDGNGCNQRDDVLLRDAEPGTARVRRQGRCAHDVLAGTWTDPYSGRTARLDDLKDLAQAQAVQIDHVVPLAEAWTSGAHAWSDQRRRAFANDLDGLLAVDGPTNAGKGADDPAAWRPRKDYQCAYAVRWVAVKHRWNLGVDESEARALREMLAYC